ncbi:MAG: cyclic nucleotide-binding domain-containing protein [Synergistaceae bacterium]|nr:cyclic nucleotide-binding domain-containing protein [Synergistaceae bacterium]
MLTAPKKKQPEIPKKPAEPMKELEELKDELAELEQSYSQGVFQLFVICGTEEAWKTMLIKEFSGWKRRITLNASVKGTSALQSFAEAVQRHYDKPPARPLNTWDGIFTYIADNERQKSRTGQRLVLVLNDFPEPSDRNEKFMRMFQNAIDQHLSQTKIFVIVSSSDMEFAEKYFLDENAPLHRNMNGSIRLEHMALDDAATQRIAEEAARTAKGISNARAKIQKVSADEVILREGETNGEIYKIITGCAVCWFKYGTENEYVLASMSDGECFGEYSVLTGNPSIYTVVAFTDMLVMKITRDDLAAFIEADAKNATEIMGNMARMMSVMAMNIDMVLNE